MSDFDFAIARQVATIASKVKDSNPRWICIPGGYYETKNGSDFCDDCGWFIMRHLRRKDRKRKSDYLLDGGWRTENDGQSFCAHCSIPLRVSLTDYGLSEELEYYRENGVHRNSLFVDAYSLDLMLDAVSWGHEATEEVFEWAKELLSRPEAQEFIPQERDSPSDRSAPSIGSTPRIDRTSDGARE